MNALVRYKPPLRSMERQALADAIARRDQAAARVETIARAQREADEKRFEAFQSLKKARGDLAEAEANATRNVANRILGGRLPAPDGRA